MGGGDLVGWPGKEGAGGGLEVGVGLAEAREEVIQFPGGDSGSLTWNGPALHLQMTPIGIAAQLAASFDERGVQ